MTGARARFQSAVVTAELKLSSIGDRHVCCMAWAASGAARRHMTMATHCSSWLRRPRRAVRLQGKRGNCMRGLNTKGSTGMVVPGFRACGVPRGLELTTLGCTW